MLTQVGGGEENNSAAGQMIARVEALERIKRKQEYTATQTCRRGVLVSTRSLRREKGGGDPKVAGNIIAAAR